MIAPICKSVPVVAHEEYIVSFHTDTGFAYTQGFFAAPHFYHESEYILYAPAHGAGGNGLYGAPGAMPTASSGNNYWVDVEFAPSPADDQPESEGTATSIWKYDTFEPTIAASTQPVEVGTRFQSARAGYIQGLRFYKGATNTGEHLANLWSSTGQLLASTTFSAETASGWQEVTFAQSVPISANTTYVASYHTTSGAWAYTTNYFQSHGAAYAPLRTMVGSGVYLQGHSGFPNQVTNDNYWVDIVFGDEPAYVKPVNTATIFPDTFQPAAIYNGGSLVQLGMKFRANRDGFINGLHYYNAAPQ